MEADFYVEAVEEAFARHGKPEIFNTDQGSQFTSHALTSVLLNAEITISMHGRGAWRDNIFVERLWRSVKYEEMDLRAYDTVSTAHASIGRYLAFYNGRRVITHAIDGWFQAPMVLRMVPKGLRPARRAVSTTVRMSASPSAAHIAR